MRVDRGLELRQQKGRYCLLSTTYAVCKRCIRDMVVMVFYLHIFILLFSYFSEAG
jgi:hypothetical protein